MTRKKKKKAASKGRFAPPTLMRFKKEQLARLVAIAETEESSRAEVVRTAVDRYLDTYTFEVAK